MLAVLQFWHLSSMAPAMDPYLVVTAHFVISLCDVVSG
jgi:hypothetical protein